MNDLEKYKTGLAKYCMYRERCRREVEIKLKKLNLPLLSKEKLISWLEQEGFLDENRFAKEYVIGKFHINKWGKTKIAHALKLKGLEPEFIQESLNQIGNEDYQNQIKDLYKKKYSSLQKASKDNTHQRTVKYLIQKGYEYDIIQTLDLGYISSFED
ncbi:MAG TPA: regulatory protein RecX [Cyclobacteriaceae bacterium]